MLCSLSMQRPGKIICVGRNYLEHAQELGNEAPKEPLLFFKPPSAVIFHEEPIVLPAASRQVEYEAEIGVVISKYLKRISEEDVPEAIAGIVCVNDVTARDLQRQDAQWTRAKGFDTFCPVGPRLQRFDPRVDMSALEVICRVNGETRQHGYARDMLFSIPRLVAYVSRIMTLEPGDLLATGTPAGVGRLAAGDTVEVEIPGVGVLTNPVIAEPA